VRSLEEVGKDDLGGRTVTVIALQARRRMRRFIGLSVKMKLWKEMSDCVEEIG
jgi:hypothetical protein